MVFGGVMDPLITLGNLSKEYLAAFIRFLVGEKGGRVDPLLSIVFFKLKIIFLKNGEGVIFF